MKQAKTVSLLTFVESADETLIIIFMSQLQFVIPITGVFP
jgi:hypothetical protein